MICAAEEESNPCMSPCPVGWSHVRAPARLTTAEELTFEIDHCLIWFYQSAWKLWDWHQWSSGRIHRCHRCDPGSIPGWCMLCLFENSEAIILFRPARACESRVAQWLACWAHNPKVHGSKPRSAICMCLSVHITYIFLHTMSLHPPDTFWCKWVRFSIWPPKSVPHAHGQLPPKYNMFLFAPPASDIFSCKWIHFHHFVM